MRYVLSLLLFLIASADCHAQVDRSKDLSDPEKLAGLSQFWSEAKYNFAFFDQTDDDWDSAYYALIPQVLATESTWEYYLKMLEFSALLRDGHTNISSPQDLFSATIYTPLRFSRTGSTFFVANVMLHEKDRVPIGAELVEIEGVRTLEWLKEHIYKYISASTEHERRSEAIRSLYYLMPDTVSTLGMTFETPDGERIDYGFRFRSSRTGWVKEAEPQSRYKLEMNGDIAHVQLNTFGQDSVVYDFRQDLDQIRQAKGVILDLRENGGGNTSTGDQILMHFTDADTLVGSAWKTREHQAAYKAWGTYYKRRNEGATSSSEDLHPFYQKALAILEGDYWYDGGVHTAANTTDRELKEMPVVVLAGNGTASAAEDFLVTLRQLPDRDIPVIGQTSFGSTGQPLPLELPGGLSARICTKRDTFRDGTDFVGSGITPDIEIVPTVEDIVRGRDVVLAKALDVLREREGD